MGDRVKGGPEGRRRFLDRAAFNREARGVLPAVAAGVEVLGDVDRHGYAWSPSEESLHMSAD